MKRTQNVYNRGVERRPLFRDDCGRLRCGAGKRWLSALQFHTRSGAIQLWPTIANGVAYFGSDGGNVYAVSLSTHALQWSYKTSTTAQTQPVIVNGIVYEDANMSVFALRATTGTLVWRHYLGSAIYKAGIAASGGLIYVGTYGGALYALKQASGSLAWSYTTGGAILDLPTVA